jgi:hypothetical protein
MLNDGVAIWFVGDGYFFCGEDDLHVQISAGDGFFRAYQLAVPGLELLAAPIPAMRAPRSDRSY